MRDIQRSESEAAKTGNAQMGYPHWMMVAGAILLAIGLVGLVFPRNGGVESDQDAAQEPTEKKANWKRERDNPDADADPLPPLPWRPPPQAR